MLSKRMFVLVAIAALNLVVLTPAKADVRGYIDRVEVGAGTVDILGWTCDGPNERKTDAHVYVGGAAGSPGAQFVTAGPANKQAERAVGTACGTKDKNHRFILSIPFEKARPLKGKPIFVHGISVTNGPNLTLHNSGVFSIPEVPQGVTGWVDALVKNDDGSMRVRGWACDRGSNKSIDVHLYAGASAYANPRGSFVAGISANLPTGAAVKAMCMDNAPHGFEFTIPRDRVKSFASKSVFVHGISVTKQTNSAIGNSGCLDFPDKGIDGVLDRADLQNDGSMILKGWACDRFEDKSIEVHVYSGADAWNGGTFVIKGRADQSNEPAVDGRCSSNGVPHRFVLTVPPSLVIANSQEGIFVHGISVSKQKNHTIKRSGQFAFPKASPNQKLSNLAVNGQDLEIPAGMTVTIDKDIDVKNVMVEGRLVCPRDGNFTLRLAGLHVAGDGSAFECGTPDKPFLGKLVVSVKAGVPFTGDHCSPPEIPCSDRNLMAMAGGVFRFTGDGRNSRWLRLARTAEAGAKEIVLTERVSWRPGDRLGLAPTGTNFLEAENPTVESVDGRLVRLTAPLQFRHIGEQESFKVGGKTWQIDERAEVANLSRNIKFVSDGARDKMGEKGAHMMVMMGGQAFIDGVEFESMGRMGEMARYPFHWHRSGDARGQFIKNSSIHHSFQRCVTVHGTLNATVENNVCFDHYAHGFFLENGDETGNRIVGNLGILSRRPLEGRHILQSDIDVSSDERFPGPSTFWISNPSNVVKGNVAVGSEGTAFWNSFNHALHCEEHVCQKATGSLPPTINPYTMPTLEFSNNVAKAAMVGFSWDGVNDGEYSGNPNNEDDRVLTTVKYNPGRVTSFDRLSAYKNRKSAVYIRSMTLEFTNFVMVGNKFGLFSAYNTRLRNSLIAARSKNMSNDDLNTLGHPVGVRIYDGPFDLADVDFVNFDPIKVGRNMLTPRAFQPTGAAEHYFNVTQRLRFSPEPEYRVLFGGAQDTKVSTGTFMSVHDLDGSLTGTADTYVYPDHALVRMDSCKADNPFLRNGLMCKTPVAQIYLYNGNPTPTPYKVTRTDRKTGVVTAPAETVHYHHVAPAMVVPDYRYELTYESPNGASLADMRLKTNSEKVGLLSPVVTITNLPTANCSVPGGERVTSLDDLRRATNDAWYSAGNFISFRIKTRADDMLIPSKFTTPGIGSLGLLTCN